MKISFTDQLKESSLYFYVQSFVFSIGFNEIKLNTNFNIVET